MLFLFIVSYNKTYYFFLNLSTTAANSIEVPTFEHTIIHHSYIKHEQRATTQILKPEKCEQHPSNRILSISQQATCHVTEVKGECFVWYCLNLYTLPY